MWQPKSWARFILVFAIVFVIAVAGWLELYSYFGPHIARTDKGIFVNYTLKNGSTEWFADYILTNSSCYVHVVNSSNQSMNANYSPEMASFDPNMKFPGQPFAYVINQTAPNHCCVKLCLN